MSFARRSAAACFFALLAFLSPLTCPLPRDRVALTATVGHAAGGLNLRDFAGLTGRPPVSFPVKDTPQKETPAGLAAVAGSAWAAPARAHRAAGRRCRS